MYRQLYQMGGIGTLPMDFGQPLQVTQQQQPLFTTTGSATSNPLLNYGQTGLNQAGGTALTRSNYQEGGLSDFYKAEEPIIPRIESIGGLLDQAEKSIGQPANNFSSPLASTFSRFGMQEGGMGMDQMMPAAGGEEQGQNALLTIIQLLIEQGIDPETAKELAARILEAFAQGGEPAVEALANQLEQEEGMQQPMMMAEGGLTSIDKARDMLQSRAPSGEFLAYINPQEAGILRLMGGAGQDVNVKGVPSFFVKSVFKAAGKIVSGAAKAVKSVAKSPIGQIALAIAAPYAIGAMFPGFATLGTASLGTFGGAALRAGISNLAIQGITTGKFDPKQALIAGLAGGALSGLTGPASAAANIDPSTGLPTNTITGTITQPSISGSLESGLGQNFYASPPDITGTITQPSSFFSPTEYGSALSTPVSTGLEGQLGTGYAVPKGNLPYQLQGVGDTSPIDMSSVYSDYSYPSTIDKFSTKLSSIGTGVQDFGNKLISDPLGTIGSGIKSTYQLAKDYPAETILAATTALGALTPQQPGEPDDSYQQRKAEYDARVAEYITQYGGGAKVYSPSFYAMEGAVDPFAGRSTYAADGGQITNRQNYFLGKMASAIATPQSGGGTGGGSGMGGMMARLIQQNPQMFKPQGTTSYDNRNLIRGDFIDENRNGIDDRQEASYGGRIGYEYGSMPMGEPRRNPAGIMELDYRKKGGFVPPIGIKEKADDIPAMLSNNEFVFTADAVRNAGRGNVNKGAQRMYRLMKQLESGGIV